MKIAACGSDNVLVRSARKGNAGCWWIYILECSDGSFYTGVSKDIRRRLREHLDGKGSRYVASRLPAKLVWSRRAGSRSRSLRLEAAVKRMRRPWKKRLVRGFVKPPSLPRIRSPRPSEG